VLHGNTYDSVRSPTWGGRRARRLAEFLAEQLFGRWSLVLPLRPWDAVSVSRPDATSSDSKRWSTLANRKVGDLSTLSKEPSATIALLERFVRNNLMAAEADRLSLA
jgi:hypothetical protein